MKSLGTSKKVYCGECRYFSKKRQVFDRNGDKWDRITCNCAHPCNTVTKDTWECRLIVSYKLHPKEINKRNDCPNYRERR